MLLVDSNVWLDAADVDCPTYLACAGLLRDRDFYLVRPKHTTGFTLLPEASPAPSTVTNALGRARCETNQRGIGVSCPGV
jgi:hypothetical protein